jgi:hypothetical protein
MRTAKILLAVTAATFVTMAAGCGGSSGGSGSGGSGGSGNGGSSTGVQAGDAYRALATCIRAHGDPTFPDPVQGSDGQWKLPDGTPDPPKAARDACATEYAALPAQGTSDDGTASAKDMEALRAFAKCVREHGIPDWPDPNPDGSFTLPARLNTGKLNFKAQNDACKQYYGGTFKIKGS